MERATTRAGILAVALLCLVAPTACGTALACDGDEAHVLLVSATDATPAPEAPAQPARPPRAARSPRAAGATPSAPAPAAAPEAPEGFDGPSPVSLVTPRGWFGFGFQCGDCSAQSVNRDSAAIWWFGDMPRVYSVDLGSPASKAGLRRGDVIAAIDGVSIVTPDGGRRFGMIRPGQVVRWTVIRNGERRDVVATAAERPERRERVALVDLQRELRRLNQLEDMDQLRREIAELNREMARRKAREEVRTQVEVRTERAQRLRYAGVIGGTEVEVRGPGSIIVSESDGNELVINTGESVVRIRVPAAARRHKADAPK